MRFFWVTLTLAALVAMAFAAAMPVADPEAAPKADPGPFLYSLTNEFATIPFDPSPKKRDVGPPSKVIRDPYLLNKNNGPQLTVTFTPKNKRQLSNIRPLLTRSPESFLTERTLPSTPTEGTDARKCGAVAGYTCHSGNGACCGGAGSGHENMCGSIQPYCAGACQSAYGYCTDPMYQIAFDADAGDILWDPISDNVFDPNLGDGMIYYGYPPTDPETADVISWPSTL